MANDTDMVLEAGDYVFGFGSLVALAELARFLDRAPLAPREYALCSLLDHRRAWDIARDNSKNLPGRPHYICAESGARPDVFITSVNIRPHAGARVNGVAFRVGDDDIARLDHREGNYDRVEVSGQIDREIPGRVWTYRGSALAEARYRHGVAAGAAVVSRQYHDIVTDAFASHGGVFLDAYHASTDTPEVPFQALQRVYPTEAEA